jgi:hypothetical protein
VVSVRTLSKFLCGGLALALSGCFAVDKFSGRAVDFNIEAEQAQMQALLLNIVRASMNRPMQFTTLSTITGTASVSGGATLGLPFGHHRPITAATPDTLTLTTNLSGGPTFTVPVLDTQEFYQGELKPLTGQEYRFFLDEGITPAVLFYIFVDGIDLTVSGSRPPQKFTFHNYVGDDFDVDQFQAVADYLLSLGLSIEQMHRGQPVGPTLTPAQVKDLRDIAQITSAGLHITPVRSAGRATAPEPAAAAAPGASTLAPKGRSAQPKKEAMERPPSQYQIEKEMVVYRPCFDAPPDKRKLIDASLLCGSMEPSDNDEQAPTGNLTRTGGFLASELAQRLQQIRAAYVAKLQSEGQPATASQVAALPTLPGNSKLQVRLYMRSTEAILHHLGSITSRYRNTDGRARVIQVKVGEPYLPYPSAPCPFTESPLPSAEVAPGYHCESLFVLDRKSSGDSPISIDYQGDTFAVPGESKRSGRTMRMLDLVKQLLALHTSAKELPASNVLNIIGGGTP